MIEKPTVLRRAAVNRLRPIGTKFHPVNVEGAIFSTKLLGSWSLHQSNDTGKLKATKSLYHATVGRERAHMVDLECSWVSKRHFPTSGWYVLFRCAHRTQEVC